MQHERDRPILDATARDRVLGVLELLADRDAQMAYQRAVPIAMVSAELLCFWDEVFWSESSELRSLFTEPEWQALLRFHSIFERVMRLMPHTPLPPIEEFVKSPHWYQLSSAAKRARIGLHAAAGGAA